MLRHRSGRVLEMGSVHVMFSVLVYYIVLVYSVLEQTLESISAGACALYEHPSHYSQMP